MLLVLTPEAAIARWARQPIETGHPGFALVPIVVELGDVPRVNEMQARSSPELAVLSTLAHPDERDVARAALDAISELEEDRGRLYWDLVLATVTSELETVLGGPMIKNYEYKSEFARKYYGEGRVEGRVEGLRIAILQIAKARFSEVSPEDEAAVHAIPDERLDRLVVSVASALTYEAFRALL